MIRSSLLSSVALCALCLPAHAQDAFELDQIVVSGSLTPIASSRTGASVEVLSGDDVGKNDSSVINRLTRLPGVNSTSNGGLGAQSGIQIRGLSSSYVGVRINGIDVADPSGTQNQFDFGGLTSAGIGRIEVLKGSQSALYGSEAIAGVVDITTFRPEKLGFSGEAQAEVGSFGTYSGALSMGHKSERGEIALSYGRIETDGISSQSFNTEKDGFDQTTVSLTGQYDITETLTLGGALFYRDSKADIDRFPPVFTGENFTEERGARSFATLQTGAITHTLSYTYFDIERLDPSGFTTRFTGERKNIAYLGSAELGAATTLSFGVDHTKEAFSSDAARGSEDNTSLMGELLFSPASNVDISAALRYDDNSSFGGETTGRLAAVWRPAEDLAFRAMVGTGFRTPSLYERFGPNGVATLSPEESRSYELGVEKTFGGIGMIKATVFYTEIENLIDYVPGGAGCASPWGCYNQLPGTSRVPGLELAGEYALSNGFSLYGNYTYTDARTSGARLSRRPRHDMVVGVSNAFSDRFEGYVDVRHVADVLPSVFAPANHKVGDYTLVGAGLSYDVSDNAEAYLRIENLFDEDYETAGGYNQPGRAAYIGIRAKF